MKLTVSEYSILNKIAEKMKKDCRFWLCHDQIGNEMVNDFEEGTVLSLKTWVSQLDKGIVSYDLCGMNAEEIVEYEHLLRKLNIPIPKERHIDYIIDCCERLLAISDKIEYEGNECEGIDTIAHEIRATAEIVKGEKNERRYF